jgi:hypothetical protein
MWNQFCSSLSSSQSCSDSFSFLWLLHRIEWFHLRLEFLIFGLFYHNMNKN